MSDWDRPAWLTRALEERDSAPVSFPDAEGPRKVRAGEIHAARPMDGEVGARLALILDDSGKGWANTMLLTNLLEAATSKDVRLDPDETRLPFPVLVETDIVGPMFVAQFGPRLGWVDDGTIAVLDQVKRGDDDHVLAERRGLPVRSRTERRVRWKEQELQAMHDLAGECFAELMAKAEQQDSVLVDPSLFDGVETEDSAAVVRRLIGLMDMGPLDVPVEVLRAEDGRLRDWLAHLDPGQMAALEKLWRDAVRDTPVAVQDAVAATWEPRREDDASLLARHVVARANRGERNIPIATSVRYWDREIREGIVKVKLADGSVVQLSPTFLEEMAA